jgi:hypothetical protein
MISQVFRMGNVYLKTSFSSNAALQYLQQPAIGPCPKPVQFNLPFYTYLSKINFNIFSHQRRLCLSGSPIEIFYAFFSFTMRAIYPPTPLSTIYEPHFLISSMSLIFNAVFI